MLSCQVVAAGQRAGQWGSARGILDAEHALWLGDLNYRLSGIADEKARTLLRAGDLEQLAKYDELAAMRRTGGAAIDPASQRDHSSQS